MGVWQSLTTICGKPQIALSWKWAGSNSKCRGTVGRALWTKLWFIMNGPLYDLLVTKQLALQTNLIDVSEPKSRLSRKISLSCLDWEIKTSPQPEWLRMQLRSVKALMVYWNKKIQGMNYKEKSNHSNAQWTDQWSCSQNIALMFGDRLENLTALHLKMATTWRQRKNYLFFFFFSFRLLRFLWTSVSFLFFLAFRLHYDLRNLTWNIHLKLYFENSHHS